MKFLCPIIISLALTLPADGQKINLEKWATHIVDSLQKEHVDTIEYFHEYCGECIVQQKPPSSTELSSKHFCEVDNSWVQLVNAVVYKQNGNYYSLNFDCDYPPIKKPLEKVKSIDYFVSIIPALNERDKKQRYLDFMVVDGDYNEAYIYWGSSKQYAHIHDDQETKSRWGSSSWVKKEIKLFRLLKADLAVKP